ncbi:uncharacterized protein LOC129224340 [Uloborus diversus]|uniref:uncharacterized protein LOC129224340 n=1 Tax=Uloborus diversus TaxID=327109 RepID=UPI00240A34DA|nr:uncharacterized protein LOC129224340 [Uloborus diversus]XP_054714757.1 uncharacterized protein LOC129224340 [Uloborus diversus]
MYQSTDQLVPNEQGTSRGSYQNIEGGRGGTTGPNVTEVPQTFLSQVRKAKEENISCCGFCMAFFALLIGSIVWTIVLIVMITVPIVMIVIGAEYFHDCPAQFMIPITLIVAGCVCMLSNVINFVDRFKRFSETGIPKRHTVIGWINVVINIFLLLWFFASCYYVYSTNPNFDEKINDGKNYCNPHLYGFAFWLLNFIFVFFGTLIIISGMVVCFAMTCW